MIRAFSFACALLVAGIACLGQQPRAWWQSIQQASVGAAGYQGPGDVVSGAKAWWGPRAYSAATRGTNAVRVCDQATGAVCADFATDATTGNLTIGTIGGSSCSIIACVIATWYDQSGANQCGAAACDLVQATNANRPVFTVSAQNSLPCGTYAAGNGNMASAAITSISQPFTTSWAGKIGNVNYRAVVGNTTGSVFSGHDVTANKVIAYTGGTVTAVASVTDANYNSVQMLFNGASTSINVNGSVTSGLDLGNTTAFTGTPSVGLVPPFNWDGDICEVGIWSGDASAVSANQRTYWGL